MKSTADYKILRIRQGERATAIRDALHLTGEKMGDLLTAHMQALGYDDEVYDKSKISRIEGGGREMSPLEAAVLAALDPMNRGLHWLLFGEKAGLFQTLMHVKRV